MVHPAGTDCAFEAICEGCRFFQTTIDFWPRLEAQRDHAKAHSSRSARSSTSVWSPPSTTTLRRADEPSETIGRAPPARPSPEYPVYPLTDHRNNCRSALSPGSPWCPRTRAPISHRRPLEVAGMCAASYSSTTARGIRPRDRTSGCPWLLAHARMFFSRSRSDAPGVSPDWPLRSALGREAVDRRPPRPPPARRVWLIKSCS